MAAQLQESQDMLLDGTPEQKVLSHRDAERKPHSDSKSGRRHAVTLDEKNDQKIFQDDSSLQRMRRLILGER